MRVVVPFTVLDPETEKALAATSGVEFWNVGRSDEAYWELLDELWTEPQDLVVVEQDIVVRPGTISGFVRCSSQWCCARYPYLGGQFTGLGCCRFRKELMVAEPDVFEEVGEYWDSSHRPKHWCVVDHALSMALARRKVPQCDLHGLVGHRDGPPSHRCCGK